MSTGRRAPPQVDTRHFFFVVEDAGGRREQGGGAGDGDGEGGRTPTRDEDADTTDEWEPQQDSQVIQIPRWAGYEPRDATMD